MNMKLTRKHALYNKHTLPLASTWLVKGRANFSRLRLIKKRLASSGVSLTLSTGWLLPCLFVFSCETQKGEKLVPTEH